MESIRKALPIVGLLLIAVGLAIFGIFYSNTLGLRENMQDRMILIALGIGGFGALLTVLGFTTQGFGPNLKYYLGYTISSIFVIGCLVMVYLIARNHTHEFDVTEQRMHSLHPRTIEFLRNLDKDVQITAFPSPDNKRDVEVFLERYTRFSPRVHYQVRNIYKDIKVAKTYAENIAPGDIFIWTGARGEGGQPNAPDFREKKLSAFGPRDLTESKMTNAIVEIMRPEKITVYFLKGHGETNLEPGGGGLMGGPGESRQSYSSVQQVLKDEMSFGVKSLELNRVGFVPDDCSLLICAGPEADLLPLEAQTISKYLESGGRALFLLDPNERTRLRFDQWQELMAHFGVKIQHDLVLEQNPLTQLTGDPTMLLVSRFGNHPTVTNQNEMVQMARVRTVAPLENRPTTLTVAELMYSSGRSWSEDVEKLREMKEIQLPETGSLKEQPLAVAVSMEAGASESKKGMRMVVIGDSDVFEDRFIPSTVRLFVNLVNWLVAREDLIDIPTKQLADTPIFPSPAQMRAIFTLLVLAFPGLIFFGGLAYVLVRRRVR
jgi:hypothetical protein